MEGKEIAVLVDEFTIGPSERKRELRTKLERLVADPRRCDVRVSLDPDGVPLALVALNRVSDHRLDLPIVRASAKELAPTVVRHLLMEAIRQARKSEVEKIHVTDTGVSSAVASALAEVGFKGIEGEWIKPVAGGFVTVTEVSSRFSIPDVNVEAPSPTQVDDIETFIWPAKLKNDAIPCYLIPIRAEWAEHFFDSDLALQRLPGIGAIRDDLHLGVEAAYYTASNVAIKAPGRILWYVSQGSEKLGSKQVKACSRLREVVIGNPKALFRRFRRLGVYEWEQLYNLADRNLDKQLVAMRFSHTERFVRPLNSRELAAIGVPPPYPGPRPVPHIKFVEIYQLGMATSV